MCHGAVKFVVARDVAGHFRYAPLGGETFRREIPAQGQVGLPDSFVIRTADGRTLVRSAAVLYVADRLGGLWRSLATLGWLVPRPVRDWMYDGIARVRKRLVAPPPTACPIVAPDLRGRFLE